MPIRNIAATAFCDFCFLYSEILICKKLQTIFVPIYILWYQYQEKAAPYDSPNTVDFFFLNCSWYHLTDLCAIEKKMKWE